MAQNQEPDEDEPDCKSKEEDTPGDVFENEDVWRWGLMRMLEDGHDSHDVEDMDWMARKLWRKMSRTTYIWILIWFVFHSPKEENEANKQNSRSWPWDHNWETFMSKSCPNSQCGKDLKKSQCGKDLKNSQCGKDLKNNNVFVAWAAKVNWGCCGRMDRLVCEAARAPSKPLLGRGFILFLFFYFIFF